MKLRKIEILEKAANKKGDLFGRLMADLFHALGYSEPRYNIHKSGRELDLTSFHRTENRIAIAECKAHVETIGGADINKFVGVIDAEKRKFKKDIQTKENSVVGYFISLSGFKETAIEQENEFGNKRVILIKPEKIVEELIRGRIIVSIEKAVSSINIQDSGLQLMNYCDLLAYDKGWIWVFYYSDNDGQKVSHFALTHAEGKPLIQDLTTEVIKVDKSLNNLFRGLTLYNQKVPSFDIIQDLANSKEKYFNYLDNELGEIQFEGLPTDKEAGSVRVKLENIFVPLHLTRISKDVDTTNVEKNRDGIGAVLKSKSRLAILAKPGGGKSTMIKRIAIAYAFPERRNQINDDLPDKDWFPIFLRCRELGDKVTQSITDIIKNIPIRAEIHSCMNGFSVLVSNALQNGKALLLIDGLDEIAEDKNRIAFVNQLRTFIATYPTINIIVTSREAGFRVVGGSLATYCENYSVSNLIDNEIETLCLKWHNVIIDDSENTSKESKKLSDLILKDERIKVLAENPLLLTTLLFVKRWAGYLPTKRSVLYQEMIKLLLVTWNVEGHEILEIEEAEPQLAFVAYWMTKNGQQTITAEELNYCLIESRKQMPEILGYTNVSPSEFIKRVELRSSLLIMSGHKRLTSGNLTAVYEFLHLSFQEYLTAKALVKRFLPQGDVQQTVVELIKPNINNENWKEVIPLAAVLLERETKDLIEYLVSESADIASTTRDRLTEDSKFAPNLLGNCLANEVQISPDLLERSIEWYSKCRILRDNGITQIILKNKFGIIFRKKVKQIFVGSYDDHYIANIGSTLSDIFLADLKDPDNGELTSNEIIKGVKSGNKEDQCFVILGMMGYAFTHVGPISDNIAAKVKSEEIFSAMLTLLKLNDSHLNFCICWSLVWSEKASMFPEPLKNEFIPYIVNIWLSDMRYHLKRVAAWALSVSLLPGLTTEGFNHDRLLEIVHENYNNPVNEFDKQVAVYIGTLIGEKWDRKEITELFEKKMNAFSHRIDNSKTLSLFIRDLGIEIKQK